MDLIFRIEIVNFVNQSIRKTLHTDRFLPADWLDSINDMNSLSPKSIDARTLTLGGERLLSLIYYLYYHRYKVRREN